MIDFKEFGMKLADKITTFIGSWTFIIIQSSLLTLWIILNVTKIVHFDLYPFILLNLFLSFEAAYATPMILMSSSRQSERDRQQLQKDIDLDENTNQVINRISLVLESIKEDIQLDKQALRDHSHTKVELNKLTSDIKAVNKKLDKLLKK
jgi:uncharacterized membrane protein